MKYASVCDGIGAVHQAWKPLGWECAWTSEIDTFPAAVVEAHHGLPNLGDMTTIDTEAASDAHGPIELLVGGTPCQSFSVAGLRKGLADPRGNLALVYLGMADRLRPRWVVWENVPGVLSSGGGRDFGTFLGAMEQLGYGWAYRTMDAQFVRVESHPRAVPQRRRRVFVVGCLGDWRCAAKVLFERQGMLGHPPPRREAWQGFAADVAPSLVSSGRGVERAGETRWQDPVIAQPVAHTLKREGHDASEDGTERGTPLAVQPVAGTLSPGANPGAYNGQDAYTGHLLPVAQPVANTLTRRMHKGINSTVDEGQTPVIAFDTTQITSKHNRSRPDAGDPCHTLAKGGHATAIAAVVPYNGAEDDTASSLGVNCGMSTGRKGARVGMGVRRLTPRECERLQGFPDDYTAIDFKGKPASDSARYKAIGNSMAVNVMSWIGQRIDLASKENHDDRNN